MVLKLIPTSERSSSSRCWFCRSDKSVNYVAQFVNPNPMSKRRFIEILVCNKCAANHMGAFIDFL